ncbi:MAG: hypothetical protein GY834_00855 [Bacteroidetes bacterium]|nr:hypothetical protein [Bacteroidota bacterium]
MDFSKILSISGKPGLYKLVTQAKAGIIVESLIDGKRFTAFSSERISSLEENSIFFKNEDIPLKNVLKTLFEKCEGKSTISHKSDAKLIKSTFEEMVPDYDQDRVYVSDIRKVLQWYNLLVEKEMLNFEEEVDEEKSDDSKDEAKSDKEESTKKEDTAK